MPFNNVRRLWSSASTATFLLGNSDAETAEDDNDYDDDEEDGRNGTQPEKEKETKKKKTNTTTTAITHATSSFSSSSSWSSRLVSSRLVTLVSSPRVQLYLVCVISLADVVMRLTIFPLAPFFVRRSGVIDDGDDDSKIGLYTGLLTAASFFGSFFSSQPWCSFSDRYGRRPALILSMFFSFATMFAFGLIKDFWIAFGVRLLSGILSATNPVTKTCVAELSNDSNVGAAYALYALFWYVGSFMGPLIGGALAEPCDQMMPFLSPDNVLCIYPYFLSSALASVIIFVVFLLSIFCLKETLNKQSDDAVVAYAELPTHSSTMEYVQHILPNESEQPPVLPAVASEGRGSSSASDLDESTTSTTTMTSTATATTTTQVESADDSGERDGSASVRLTTEQTENGESSASLLDPTAAAEEDSDTTPLVQSVAAAPVSSPADEQNAAEQNAATGIAATTVTAVQEVTIEEYPQQQQHLVPVWRNWEAVLPILIYVILGLGDIILFQSYSLWAMWPPDDSGLGFSSFYIGLSTSLSTLLLLLYLKFFYRRVEARFSRTKLTKIGFLVGLVVFAVPLVGNLPASLNMWVKFTAAVLLVATVEIGTENSYIGVNCLMSDCVHPAQRNTVNGIALTIVSLSRSGGPFASGVIWAFSAQQHFLFHQAIPFWVSGVLFAIAYVLTLQIKPVPSWKQSKSNGAPPPPPPAATRSAAAESSRSSSSSEAIELTTVHAMA